jgi:hypothetical protein
LVPDAGRLSMDTQSGAAGSVPREPTQFMLRRSTWMTISW